MANVKTDLNALLAVTFETTIAKSKTFQIKLEDFPIEAARAFMAYGIQRKFNDSVGGSDMTPEAKVEAVTLMIEEWKAGKIGRQPSAAVPNLTKVIRSILRGMVKVQASTEAWKRFTDKEAGAQAEWLDAKFASLPEAKQAEITKQAQAQIKLAEEQAAASKKLGEGLGDLDL